MPAAEGLTDLIPPIHRAGHAFVAAGAVATLVLFVLWSPLGWLAALATLLIAFAFRDPDRVAPLREGLVLSPGDGRVIEIGPAAPPPELGLGDGERPRIAIQVTPLDVAIVRAPVAGRLVKALDVPGRLLGDGSSGAPGDGERRACLLRSAAGTEIALVLVPGWLGRSVQAFVEAGGDVGAGQRLGLVRLGGRLDLYLPSGRHVQVAVGQRLIAGETVLADLASEEPTREARRV